MFHRLQIKSQSLFMFRCKDCKDILFRQDDIDQFISYDADDLGNLQLYSSYPKLDQHIEYFVLRPNLFIDTLEVNYEQNFLKNYHPFLKMYMFGISCRKCQMPLGLQVQTVNENTAWMEGRMLIDVEKCSVLKQNKDQMPKLIEILQSRLAKKLNLAEQSHEQNVQNREMQIIRKYENMNLKDQNQSRSMKSKGQTIDKGSRDLKRKFESIQTTNPCTNLFSKPETVRNENSNYQSSFFGNQQSFIPYQKSARSKTLTARSFSHLQKNQGKSNIKVICQDRKVIIKDEPQNEQFCHLNYSQQQRNQLQAYLCTFKQQILKQSETLHSHETISKLFVQLDRLQKHWGDTFKKCISQAIQTNYLLTKIRKNVIQSFNEVV